MFEFVVSFNPHIRDPLLLIHEIRPAPPEGDAHPRPLIDFVTIPAEVGAALMLLAAQQGVRT